MEARHRVQQAVGGVLWGVVAAGWWLMRMALCALLVLIEPLLGLTLVPLAFAAFLVTLVFGFLIGDPHFPRWGMLAFSIGLLWTYWLFLALMGLLLRLP